MWVPLGWDSLDPPSIPRRPCLCPPFSLRRVTMERWDPEDSPEKRYGVLHPLRGGVLQRLRRGDEAVPRPRWALLGCRCDPGVGGTSHSHHFGEKRPPCLGCPLNAPSALTGTQRSARPQRPPRNPRPPGKCCSKTLIPVLSQTRRVLCPPPQHPSPPQGVRGMDGPVGPKGNLVSSGGGGGVASSSHLGAVSLPAAVSPPVSLCGVPVPTMIPPPGTSHVPLGTPVRTPLGTQALTHRL